MDEDDASGGQGEAVRELLGARPGECVVCYVGRMVERFGCDGTWRWTLTWQEQRAPRASRLVGRLAARGARCDCEMRVRSYEHDPRLMSSAWEAVTGETVPCMGVRQGSSQPCRLWQPAAREWWSVELHATGAPAPGPHG